MAQLLASNVAGTLNVTGVVTMNASPLSNLETRVVTAISANMVANVQTTAVLTATNTLTCNITETGLYEIWAMIAFGQSGAAGANAANIGMNIRFAGAATIGSIKYSAQGRSNGNTIMSNLITTAAQTAVIPNTTGSMAISTTNADYLILAGVINITATGNINIGFGAANTLNSNLNICSNSTVVYTKIG